MHIAHTRPGISALLQPTDRPPAVSSGPRGPAAGLLAPFGRSRSARFCPSFSGRASRRGAMPSIDHGCRSEPLTEHRRPSIAVMAAGASRRQGASQGGEAPSSRVGHSAVDTAGLQRDSPQSGSGLSGRQEQRQRPRDDQQDDIRHRSRPPQPINKSTIE